MLKFIWAILNDYLAIISAVIAIIVSVFSLVESKRKSVLSSISSNRIVWISELREEMHKFLEEYLKKDGNEYNLRILRAKIELYLRDSKMYNDFLLQLEKCSIEPFSESNYKILVNESQKILNDAWRRMKREAGISYRYDRRLTNKIEEEKIRKSLVYKRKIPVRNYELTLLSTNSFSHPPATINWRVTIASGRFGPKFTQKRPGRPNRHN